MSGFASPASLTDRCFERISDIMYDAIGLSLSDAKKPLVTSRLGPRIQRLGLDGFEDYIARLEEVSGVPVGLVSTGSDRDETIIRADRPLAGWISR